MSVKRVGLSWIVVKDIKLAVKYYTEVVGLKLLEFHEQHGWAELGGQEDETRLGIAQASSEEILRPGQNAVVTFSVDHIENTKKEMIEKGARCVGDIIEVPGHIKMQSMQDSDGNHYQICEILS